MDEAPFEWMRIGYTAALHRYDAAGEQNVVAAYAAVFECLNWATAVDDRVGAQWGPDGRPLNWNWRARLGQGAEVMAGVRFARNRVHHQWSNAIATDPGLITRLITPVGDWVWRQACDLPRGRDSRGEDVYIEHLAGQSVRGSLTVLSNVFFTLQHLLEPLRAGP
jgi:hypothetical protein